MYSNIVLTGPMGSGKSSLSKLLAKKVAFEAVDLDEEIVRYCGMSINRIFGLHGEKYFRDIEHRLLSQLARRKQMVLATGGGVVIREDNRLLLRQTGLVVNLVASVEELSARLEKASDRPLLAGEEPRMEKIARILKEREQFYADADIRIDTTGKTLEDICAEITQQYHFTGTP